MFDTFLMVDWSGGNDRGAKPTDNAIWSAAVISGKAQDPRYHRNRQIAEEWITTFLEEEHGAGRRVLAGFDFAFGYPTGFGETLTGSSDAFAIWDWFEARVEDSPKSNNRFHLADTINAALPGVGPFWGHPVGWSLPHLPQKGSARTKAPFAEKRQAEESAKGAKTLWQLYGNGAVGSQVIMGLPMLARLRRSFGSSLSVWPFEAPDTQIVLAEIWPSLIAKAIDAIPASHPIKDAHQVNTLARAFSELSPDTLAQMFDVAQTGEGWILGLGHEAALAARARGVQLPPPLKNDCFAMPQGAHWTPVDQALEHLKNHLSAVTGVEEYALKDAAGRVLAADVVAARSHPPAPNAAVDGYGFAGPAPEGLCEFSLVKGRAAAGAPYERAVPNGQAIRILTGANLPDGVDTVVLQEDVAVNDGVLSFYGPLKKGANARRAGEDMQAGQVILNAGRRLTVADIGTCAAAGVGKAQLRKQLRVGILSTGDELSEPGTPAGEGHIFDANRPMLLNLVRSWGYEGVDLGPGPDDRAALGRILNDAAVHCDVILTSGGASGGDEDHISALLQDTGSFALWRVAVKPGRPLVMGLWQGVPVIGLPGNPVAAFVCSLIFAAPALSTLTGSGWKDATRYMLPAGFSKTKKAGRREYLRARLENGIVQVFPSEGSGRISGLSWATGLVELGDDAQTVSPGDPVAFLPFSEFGK